MAININKLKEEAKQELDAEMLEAAKDNLKTLYIREEKAKLALKNIQKDIEEYLKEIEDYATYQLAGVDVSGQ